MPEACRALLDLNVILDVFQRRQPFYDDSATVLAAAETGRLGGLVAAHSVTTLFYLVTRDRAGYAAGPLSALAPAELLALLPDAADRGPRPERATRQSTPRQSTRIPVERVGGPGRRA